MMFGSISASLIGSAAGSPESSVRAAAGTGHFLGSELTRGSWSSVTISR